MRNANTSSLPGARKAAPTVTGVAAKTFTAAAGTTVSAKFGCRGHYLRLSIELADIY